MSFRTRRCNNPKPSYGGEPCRGKSEEYKLCNIYRFHIVQKTKFTCSCCRCINGKDFRAQQCENEFFIAAPGNRAEAGQQNWIPFEHTDNEFKCKLACYNRDTKVKKNILNF